MNSQSQSQGDLNFSKQCELATLSDTQLEIETLMQDIFNDDIKLNFVTLSIIEVLANVFEHGSEGSDGSDGSAKDVILAISTEGSTVTATIENNGKRIPEKVIAAISGSSMTMPDVDVQLDDLPDSGWGLNLIQHACSSVNYRRDKNRNYLELNFDCNSNA